MNTQNNKKGFALSQSKGFTLIEMLVVVAVIAVLAGITLTGVGGFTSRARDTRRVGDLRSVQNYLEFYFSKCGRYPGATACGATNPSTWADVQSALNSYGAKTPADPVAAKTYFYGVSSDGLRYVLGAKLENDNRILEESSEMDSADIPSGFTFTGGLSASDCNDAAGTYGYCIGS